MSNADFLLRIFPKRSQCQLMKLSGQHRLRRSRKWMALNRSKPDADIEQRNSNSSCHRNAASDDMLNQTLLMGSVESYVLNMPRNDVPISPRQHLALSRRLLMAIYLFDLCSQHSGVG